MGKSTVVAIGLNEVNMGTPILLTRFVGSGGLYQELVYGYPDNEVFNDSCAITTTGLNNLVTFLNKGPYVPTIEGWKDIGHYVVSIEYIKGSCHLVSSRINHDIELWADVLNMAVNDEKCTIDLSDWMVSFVRDSSINHFNLDISINNPCIPRLIPAVSIQSFLPLFD